MLPGLSNFVFDKVTYREKADLATQSFMFRPPCLCLGLHPGLCSYGSFYGSLRTGPWALGHFRKKAALDFLGSLLCGCLPPAALLLLKPVLLLSVVLLRDSTRLSATPSGTQVPCSHPAARFEHQKPGQAGTWSNYHLHASPANRTLLLSAACRQSKTNGKHAWPVASSLAPGHREQQPWRILASEAAERLASTCSRISTRQARQARCMRCCTTEVRLQQTDGKRSEERTFVIFDCR